MLANRKQEWQEFQIEAEVKPVVKPAAKRADSGVRRQGLQIMFLVIAAVMLITVHSEAIIHSGYDLVQMKAQAAQLEKENEALKLDIAKLKSPQRIQQIATSELGMVQPQNAYYASAAAPAAAAAKRQPQSAGMLELSKAEASKGH